jgi:hypothetical protein
MAEKIGKIECKSITRMPRNNVFFTMYFENTIQRQDTLQHSDI